MAEPAVVVTEGGGSIDLCAQQLAARLPLRRIDTDIGRESAERFGIPRFSLEALRCAQADSRFIGALRRDGGPLHLTGHHLARYGPLAGCPYIVTVHDLMRWFDLRGRGEPLIHRPNRRDRIVLARDYRGIRHANGVIAISEVTRQDLIQHLGVPEERIAVIQNGVDHGVFRRVERRLFDFPYVLYVGSEQPRKNVPLLVRAFAHAAAEQSSRDLRLVKVGDVGGTEGPWREQTEAAIREAGVEDRVVLTERLGEEDLVAAYSSAACLVLASRYEGFGLPVIEAMACGCPVIVSDAGSLPEVVGDAGLVVPVGDEPALAAAIHEAVDGGGGSEMAERGLRRAAQFSWERTARETLAAYERLLPAGHTSDQRQEFV